MKNYHSIIKRAAVCLSAVLLLMSILFCTVSCTQKQVYTSTYFDAFDTVLTLHILSDSRKDAEIHAKAIHDIVLDMHRQFDIYHTYDGMSNLKTVNDAAGSGIPISVSRDVIELLLLGNRMYEETEGRVNIAMGAVLSIWHTYRQKGETLPPMQELQDAAVSCNIEKMVIDETNSTVMLLDPAMSLDVGAIAKGYVAQVVLSYARANGVDHMLFDLGGHILALGTRQGGKPWQIGIRDPYGGGVYTTLSITDASVVSSGIDQRFYVVDGQAYHHLIDTTTLMPATYHAAVSVVVPLTQTKEADGISTALFLMPEAEGKTWMENYSPQTEVIWIPKA